MKLDNTQQTRPHFYLALLALLALVAMYFIWPHLKPRHATIISDAPIVHQDGSSDALIDETSYETIPIKQEGPYTTVDVTYPRFKKLSTLENDKIANSYTDFVKEHIENSESNYKARLATMTSEEKKAQGTGTIKTEDKYPAQGNFTIVQSNDHYISVLFSYSAFQGGAHGFENISSFNYDLEKKKEVTLSDLLANSVKDPNMLADQIPKAVLQYVSDASREKLFEKLVPNAVYNKNLDDIHADDNDLSLVEMLFAGTVPDNENFKVFTFTPTDLTLYFGQYQVAPYVYGDQQVTLPIK